MSYIIPMKISADQEKLHCDNQSPEIDYLRVARQLCSRYNGFLPT